METYANYMPFYAAILAGEFTDNAITQLESQGFYVLHFGYEDICALFDTVEMNIRWDESTSDAKPQAIVNHLKALSDSDVEGLRRAFYVRFETRLEKFSGALLEALNTVISQVIVIPIHGAAHVAASVDDAVRYITGYKETGKHEIPLLRYEITVRYSNGDEYTMKCADKHKAVKFLRQYG